MVAAKLRNLGWEVIRYVVDVHAFDAGGEARGPKRVQPSPECQAGADALFAVFGIAARVEIHARSQAELAIEQIWFAKAGRVPLKVLPRHRFQAKLLARAAEGPAAEHV